MVRYLLHFADREILSLRKSDKEPSKYHLQWNCQTSLFIHLKITAQLVKRGRCRLVKFPRYNVTIYWREIFFQEYMWFHELVCFIWFCITRIMWTGFRSCLEYFIGLTYSVLIQEMLRPIPVALASCTRFFEAMSAMRESFSTLQNLRVGHSSSSTMTPNNAPSQRISGESDCVTPWRSESW